MEPVRGLSLALGVPVTHPQRFKFNLSGIPPGPAARSFRALHEIRFCHQFIKHWSCHPHVVRLPLISAFRRLRQEDSQKESLPKQSKIHLFRRLMKSSHCDSGQSRKGWWREKGIQEGSQGLAEEDTRYLNLETRVRF